MDNYKIKLYLGYGFLPFDKYKYTYEFSFTDLEDFKHNFLKRFGNTTAPNEVDKDKSKVKKYTRELNSLEDIIQWQNFINIRTNWSVEIIFLDYKKENLYHIKIEKDVWRNN